MVQDKKVFRILIIEDNPGDLCIVEDMLQERISDPIILSAGNFKQASDLLSRDVLFDVIILDLSLPDKRGLDLITGILDIALSCPVIVLTGFPDIDFSIQSISLGISDYIVKEELSDIILYKSITYAIERKKNISRLEESEKRYSDLFHLSPQPMWVCESETLDFVDVNKAATIHYGYSREEFLSMKISGLFAVEDWLKAGDSILHSGKQGADLSSDTFKHRKKNGYDLSVNLASSTIIFKGKKAVLVLANDITERTKHVAAIEQQNSKLREIAWIQSHKVRAPLARTMAITYLIRDQKGICSTHGDLLEKFVESALELDKIIREISKTAESMNFNLT